MARLPTLILDSEPVAATGNIASEGVLNQLGRPDLDPLSVLVRETVQNSWDARDPGQRVVRFGMHAWHPDAEQLHALRTTVFNDRPPKLGLTDALKRKLVLLAITDRGTTGLGGPTRADVRPSKGERTDFVGLLRNIGQPPDKRLGGGTFGYGKAILYLASNSHTICVHTHCKWKGNTEKRFIASALGAHYSQGGAYFTGRHWWGQRQAGVVEPVTGEQADRIALKLGMPGFEDSEHGTTILILAPEFGERTPQEAMQFMGENLLWYFWPKMINESRGRVSMDFSLSWQGQELPLPDPRDYPPLQGFVGAMQKVRENDAAEEVDTPFSVTRPIKVRGSHHVGTIAIEKFLRIERKQDCTGSDDSWPPIGGHCHHVALMRQAELVVCYREGPPLASDDVEYAGVFQSRPEYDEAFARSEPPTHDAWIPKSLVDKNEATYVRRALYRIDEEMESFAAPPPGSNPTGDLEPIAQFADTLGELLPGVEGPAQGGPVAVPPWGAGKESAGSGGSGRPRRSEAGPRISVFGPGRPAMVGRQRALRVDFELEHARHTSSTILNIRAAVVLDDNELEVDPPEGLGTPQVICWISPTEEEFSGGSSRTLEESGKWTVYVSLPTDAMVNVTLEAEAGGEL